MALSHSFDRAAEAELLKNADESVIADGIRTRDIAGRSIKPEATGALCDAVIPALDSLGR